MAIKTRAERRARRKRVLGAAIRLAHELFPEDETKRHEWLVSTIAGAIDIPLLSEKAERRVLHELIELIEDLVD